MNRFGTTAMRRDAAGLAGWIRRHPFASFYTLAVAFAIVLWSYLVVMEVLAPNMYGPGVGVFAKFQANMAGLQQTAPLLMQHRDSILVYLTLYAMLPLAAPFFFFPFAPTASALIITALGYGAPTVKALLGAYLPVRGAVGVRQALRLYGVLLLVLVSLVAGALLYDSLFNAAQRVPHMVELWGLSNLQLFAAGWTLALLTNQGGLLEELGWRGYAWPVLVRKFGQPLQAAVLLGVAWALWHLPREVVPILTGKITLLKLLQEQAQFIVACVGMTLLAVVFVNLSGGSVWPAILVHGCFNFLYGGFAAGGSDRAIDSLEPALLWALVGLVTVLFAGRDLGWQRRMQIHGGDGRSDPANQWALRT